MSKTSRQRPKVERFSDRLEEWLQSDKAKTLGNLNQAFGAKGLMVTVLMLMILPALPLPTGGITHIFEFFTIVLCLPLLTGRETIWMPGFIARRQLGKLTTGKFVPAILKLVRKLERFSRPRGVRIMHLPPFRIMSAVTIIGLAVAAALAPPFSGLDTLPALGVVIICLGIILDDAWFFAGGIVAGLAGIYTIIFIGTRLTHFLHSLLS